MKSSLKRSCFAAVAVGAGLILGVTTNASAAARPTPDVAASLRAEIAAQLRYNPNGTVINSQQVSYDNGHVIVTVPDPNSRTSPQLGDGQCKGGHVCIWEYSDYVGSSASITGPLDSNIPIRAYIPQVETLDNQRSDGSILSNGTTAICYPAGAQAKSISSPYSKYPWLYLEHAKNCN
jgi:hypothetical protein